MVIILLADGFEELEALSPLDILRRENIEVKTVGIKNKTVTGSHGITVLADLCCDEVDLNKVELAIFPGGMPGTTNLDASAVVHRALDDAKTNGTLIAAICAAPMILGKRGDLRGKEAICYPGFEKYLDGATVSENRVVTDGRTITAAGMGVALEFGLALVSALCSPEKAEALRRAVIAD